jgi:hypothetical protein
MCKWDDREEVLQNLHVQVSEKYAMRKAAYAFYCTVNLLNFLRIVPPLHIRIMHYMEVNVKFTLQELHPRETSWQQPYRGLRVP